MEWDSGNKSRRIEESIQGEAELPGYGGEQKKARVQKSSE